MSKVIDDLIGRKQFPTIHCRTGKRSFWTGEDLVMSEIEYVGNEITSNIRASEANIREESSQ
jgi:hypothetical protein